MSNSFLVNKIWLRILKNPNRKTFHDLGLDFVYMLAQKRVCRSIGWTSRRESYS